MVRSLLFVAGEASGDSHGAALLRSLRSSLPEYSIFGIGGDQLIDEELEPLFHISETQVTGFVEVAKRYSFFRAALRKVLEEARKRRPEFAILVDYPGFNLRLAQGLHELGIPVYYYIAPQLWAWKEGRIRYLQKFVKKLIVLFPFELRYFSERGVPTEYFGHPLINRLEKEQDERSLAAQSIIGDDPRKIIAYMPGSRQNEGFATCT